MFKKLHKDTDCEKELENEFKKWIKGKIVKQCPNCKIWTEKTEGCNHMTCAECKYQCCWLCLSKYSSHHFYGKCYGLQFYKPISEEEIKQVLNNPNSNKRKKQKIILIIIIKIMD